MPSADPSISPSTNTAVREAAFFDVDGTIVATHIVHQFIYIQRRLLVRDRVPTTRIRYGLWLSAFYVRCVRYLWLDRISRSRMNIAFYRNYAGLSADLVRGAASDCFRSVLEPNLFPEAVKCSVDHTSCGRILVLVTGSLDFLIEPLVSYLRSKCGAGAQIHLIARSLVSRDGLFSGELDGPPIGEAEKSRLVRAFAAREGIDLSRSYAYGDSIADEPMLACVGRPTAVNPDRALQRIASERDWARLQWSLDRDRA